MKINGITNTINFGLTKSLYYKHLESIFMDEAKQEGKDEIAAFIAKEIGKKLPNSLLDTDRYMHKFILVRNIKEKPLICYDFGEIDWANPINTLVNLHRKLTKFNINTPNAKRIYEQDDVKLNHTYSIQGEKQKKEMYIDNF